MIRLTIDAALELRRRYATLEELRNVLDVAEATAANARNRDGISERTARRVAEVLGRDLFEIVTFATPDEETILDLERQLAEAQEDNERLQRALTTSQTTAAVLQRQLDRQLTARQLGDQWPALEAAITEEPTL